MGNASEKRHALKYEIILADSLEKMEQRPGDEVRRITRSQEKVNYFGGEDSEDEIDVIDEDDSCSSESSASDIESEEMDDDEMDEDVNEQQNASTRRRKYAYGKDKHK
ncbi:unnamed protein product [Hermetia illucens]|uniref:Uncharacterized protein n=1 Tax=Hermetia illucens TaxID=343691 RepID=A0A7R8YPT2_HERIL|nr:unnamed protein product [Hermetia illucens]